MRIIMIATLLNLLPLQLIRTSKVALAKARVSSLSLLSIEITMLYPTQNKKFQNDNLWTEYISKKILSVYYLDDNVDFSIDIFNSLHVQSHA
jgi:hypothetical protein